MLAKRSSALAVKFGPALPRGASGVFANAPAADVWLDARLPWLCERRGLDFNSGRPPAIEWMMSAEQYKHDRHRLKLLGNAVVPLQANLAARILASGPQAMARAGPQAVARAGARERHCDRKRQVYTGDAGGGGRAGECQALARGRGACVALTFRSSAIKV